MELLPWVTPYKRLLCSMQLNLNPNSLDYLIQNNIPHYPVLLCINMSNEIINYLITNQDKIRHFTSTMPSLTFTIDNICEYVFNCESTLHYTQGILLNARYISLIEKNLKLLNKSNRNILYANSEALHLVDLNPEVIAWDYLSCNTNPIAIQILKENIDEIYWVYLSENPSAIEILTEHQDKIIFRTLAKNPNAIELIKKYINKIDLVHLTYNTNPEALDIVEKQLDTLTNWAPLCMNPAAIKILEKHKHKINWYWLSQNPAIFEYNYLKMAKERMTILREELMMKSLHPLRIAKLIELGCDIDDL